MDGPKSWHTKKERDLIESRGGTWKNQYGVDGSIDGRPVEVRVAKKDSRFRIGRDVHEELVDEGGSYIFDVVGDGKPSKEVPASEVQEMTHGDPWYDDRDYPHRFINTDEIF